MKTGEHNSLVLESPTLHNIPDANISCISDQQLTTHLCQCRAVFPFQISAGLVTGTQDILFHDHLPHLEFLSHGNYKKLEIVVS